MPGNEPTPAPAPQSNPLANLMIIVGAGLCLGTAGYEDVDALTTFPAVIILVGGIVAAVCALTGLVAASPNSDRAAVLIGAILLGYVANDLVVVLKYSGEFEGATVLATFGCVALSIGILSSFMPGGAAPTSLPNLARSVSSPAETAPPASSAAPAGWYPDPAGGPGQRYWDGEQWGHASNP